MPTARMCCRHWRPYQPTQNYETLPLENIASGPFSQRNKRSSPLPPELNDAPYQTKNAGERTSKTRRRKWKSHKKTQDGRRSEGNNRPPLLMITWFCSEISATEVWRWSTEAGRSVYQLHDWISGNFSDIFRYAMRSVMITFIWSISTHRSSQIVDTHWSTSFYGNLHVIITTLISVYKHVCAIRGRLTSCIRVGWIRGSGWIPAGVDREFAELWMVRSRMDFSHFVLQWANDLSGWSQIFLCNRVSGSGHRCKSYDHLNFINLK